jgi:hypothetical protein
MTFYAGLCLSILCKTLSLQDSSIKSSSTGRRKEFCCIRNVCMVVVLYSLIDIGLCSGGPDTTIVDKIPQLSSVDKGCRMMWSFPTTS